MTTIFSFILNAVLFIVFLLLFLVGGLVVFGALFRLKVRLCLNKLKKQIKKGELPDFKKISPPIFKKTIDKKFKEIFGSLDYKNYFNIRYIYSGNNRKIECIECKSCIKGKPNTKYIKKVYKGLLFLSAVNTMIIKQD